MNGTWYDCFSQSASAPCVVLLTGLGAQAIEQWDDPLCLGLAEQGYCVLRLDNRDVRPPVVGASFTLGDLADDALSLVAALKLQTPFHVVGASMGGMIAQQLALAMPSAVKTLSCLFSSARGSIVSASFAPGGGGGHEIDVASRVALAKGLNTGSVFPLDLDRVEAAAREAVRRGLNPLVVARQFQALLGFGGHQSKLAELAMPVLVVHGDEDRVIPIQYGRELADAFAPGYAQFREIKGMAHFLAPGAWALIEPLLLAHVRA